MLERVNIIGALTAHGIYVFSTMVFLARIFLGAKPGFWIGVPVLLMAFPLIYLLAKAPGLERGPVYYLQVILMLLFIIVLFLVDYVFKVDFRQTQWMVISFVVFYFAAMGGMLGVAAEAGRAWMISAVIWFFIAGILAFVQRVITGY